MHMCVIISFCKMLYSVYIYVYNCTMIEMLVCNNPMYTQKDKEHVIELYVNIVLSFNA